MRLASSKVRPIDRFPPLGTLMFPRRRDYSAWWRLSYNTPADLHVYVRRARVVQSVLRAARLRRPSRLRVRADQLEDLWKGLQPLQTDKVPLAVCRRALS